MKLINKTQTFYLPLIIALLIVWSGGFLWYIAWEMDQNIDDALENELETAIHELQSDGQSPDLLAESIIFSIQPIPAVSNPEEVFKDTLLSDPEDGEPEPFRQVSSETLIDGNPYRVTLRKSQLEYDDLFSTIIVALLVFVVLLMASVIVINRRFLQRIWDPFYATLGELSSYRVEDDSSVAPVDSDIDEFKELNTGLQRLLHRVEEDYERLKQFAENASHEIQTPLAAIQNQVELLMQDEAMTKTRRKRLGTIQTMTGRLSRLNSALLLLTKIENNQYALQQSVNVSALIESLVEQYRELAGAKAISFTIDIDPNVKLMINEDLAAMLFRNLFSNAVKHNIANGSVSVILTDANFRITNTGPAPQGGTAHLFDRFQKEDGRSESLGLGLSIVQTIAKTNNLKVNYQFRDPKHIVTVAFPYPRIKSAD